MTREKKKAYRFGHMAELYAAGYLCLKGYRIHSTRYRNPKGEIDIVASKGKLLIAVEVKGRRNLDSGAESVHHFKQRKILGAVEWLLAGRAAIAGLANAHERDIRFDVVLVAPWRLPKHIKDAWRT